MDASTLYRNAPDARFLPPHQRAQLERANKPTGCLSKGLPDRRILSSVVKDGVRYEFHATKGPRQQRVEA